MRAVSRQKRAMVPRRALLLASVLRPGLGRFQGRRALSNAPPPPPRDEEAPWRDGRVVAVCGSTLTMMLGHGVAAPCVPLLSSSLGASAADVGVALSTFGMARLALNVPVGAAADAWGRKPLLVGGALVNAVGHAASAAAPDAASFAAARMVAGAGNAAYLGTAATYLNDVATATNRGRVLGMNHAALLCGVSLGPVLGGFAAEYSLRAPFVAVAVLGVVSAAHAGLALSETKPETTAEAARAGETSTRDLLSDGRFAGAAVAHAATFALRQGGRNLLLALVASSVFDYSPAELGQLFGAMALCDLAFVGPAAALSDRAKDARSIVVPSLLGSALAVAGVAGVVSLGAEYHAHFLAAVGLWSLSTAALGPTLPSYAAALVDPAARGVGIAAFRSAGDVGFVVTPLLLGGVFDAHGGPAALLALAGGTALAAATFAVASTPVVER